MLAEVERGGTHEIADILDEQQIKPRERQLMQSLVYEICVEMTGGARRNLHGRYAASTDARRVILGLQVALDDRDPVALGQRVDGGFKQRGLSRPRRGHQIDDQDTVLIEVRAIMRGETVVRAAQIAQHLDDERRTSRRLTATAVLAHRRIPLVSQFKCISTRSRRSS